MFSARIRVITLLGFRVSVDITWFFLAFYLVLSLSTRYFPSQVPHLDNRLYLILGFSGALGLFLSIILHEFAHAIVARSFGLPIGGITLFIFGGVAELKQEPETPRAEFWVAIAGPVSSILIASACFAAMLFAQQAGLKLAATLLSFFAVVNTGLALFNLVPAFPLDGGRILRSILWWRLGNLKRATRIAAACGSIFGGVLILTGIMQMIGGNSLGGTWQLLIGIFLSLAAAQSRTQTDVAQNLRGVSAAQIMEHPPLLAPANITVTKLVQEYMYRHNRQFILIGEDGKTFGYVTPEQVRKVPQDQWSETYVRAIMAHFTHDTAVHPQTAAVEALRKMQSNGVGYVAVLEGSRSFGVISLSNAINYIRVREEIPA